jgi:hypothetical protein
MRKVSKQSQKLSNYLVKNPTAKAVTVARLFDVSLATVYQRKAKLKSAATKGNKFVTAKQMVKDVVDGYNKSVRQKPSTLVPNAVASMALYADDMVNHPPHYKTGGIETIDFIEAKNLGYNLGNVVKYISRADYKGDRLENLKKAQWYMNREVDLASKK